MFYVMYVSSTKSFIETKQFTIKSLQNATLNEDTELELVLSDDPFTLRVTHKGNNLQFASEDYGHTFHYCFWFDIINGFEAWSEELIRFVNSIMLNIADICVLESNGEKPFIYKTDEGLFLDRDLGGSKEFPYELLTQSWEDRKLEREEVEGQVAVSTTKIETP